MAQVLSTRVAGRAQRGWAWVPLALFLGVILGILAKGYLPPDDALRHAAFAVGSRPWAEILVGRPEALFDQSPGWHALLKGVHHLTGWGPEGLVIFSVLVCLLTFFIVGCEWVRHWEAWVLSLGLLFLVDGALIQRLALGRPFVLTGAATLMLLGDLKVPKERPWAERWHLRSVVLGALVTWVHGSWYLLLLLPLALIFARRPKEATQLFVYLIVGVLMGAVFTGHPLRFLMGQAAHLHAALGHAAPAGALAMEFRPGGQTFWTLGILALAAGLPGKRGGCPAGRDPVLALALLGWVAGYFWVWRIYLDWALPAMALWVAWRLDDWFEILSLDWVGRCQAGGMAAVIFALAGLHNAAGRWDNKLPEVGLNGANPVEQGLVPEPGGILYSDSMWVFYGTFFHNPNGPWRYVLGYEPGLMTPEDRTVVENAKTSSDIRRAFHPWVMKMRPQDRLVLEGNSGSRPAIPELQWRYVHPGKWVGKVMVPSPAP